MTSGKVSEEVQPVPEGGYGWVVVIVTFFIYSLMGMLLASFPVMYKEYMYAFDTGAVLVGSVLSCHVIFNNLAGFLFSGILRHIDLRIVAATGSLVSAFSCFLASFSDGILMLAVSYALSGAGIGVTYISISPVVHQYFCKKRTLVSGITIAGMSLGTFILPQLARYSVDFLGWRGAVRVFAALLMQNVWLSVLQRPRLKATVGTSSDKHTSRNWHQKCCNYITSLMDLTVLKKPGYLLYVSATFCTSLGCTGYMMHITNKCLSDGIDQHSAALAPSISGIVNLIWRPAFGMIATKAPLRNNTCVLYGVAGIFMGIAISLVAATHTFVYTVIAIIPVSIGLATLAIMLQPALVSLVGLENMSRALSVLMPAMGAGQFTAPPFAAWLFEFSGSYTLPYIVLGCTSVVGGLAALLIGPVSRKCSDIPHDDDKDNTDLCTEKGETMKDTNLK